MSLPHPLNPASATSQMRDFIRQQEPAITGRASLHQQLRLLGLTEDAVGSMTGFTDELAAAWLAKTLEQRLEVT